MKRWLAVAALIAGVVLVFALLLGGLYCTEAQGATRTDTYPLHYTSKGPRVRDAQFLMAHNRHHYPVYRGKITGRYDLKTAKAARRIRYLIGDPEPRTTYDRRTRSYLLPIRNGGVRLPAAWAARKAKRDPGLYPLAYGSIGPKVEDAAWLLSGHNRWKFRTYFGPIHTAFYSLDLAKASCRMKFRLGWPISYFNDSGPKATATCRRFGPQVKGYLLPLPPRGKGRPLPDSNWRLRLKNRVPEPPRPKPSKTQGIVQRVVADALFAKQNAAAIHYTQDYRRWSQIDGRIFMPPSIAPYSDCSAFVTGAYWASMTQVGGYGPRGPPDILNGLNWTAGYTGTLATHGQRVSVYDAEPGDLVLYGYAFPYGHVAVVVSGHGSSAFVVSHGSEGGPYYVPMYYRSDLAQVRRYVF